MIVGGADDLSTATGRLKRVILNMPFFHDVVEPRSFSTGISVCMTPKVTQYSINRL